MKFDLVWESYALSTGSCTVDQILQRVFIGPGLGLLPQFDLESDYSQQ
jgi:hypothetical protein